MEGHADMGGGVWQVAPGADWETPSVQDGEGLGLQQEQAQVWGKPPQNIWLPAA